MNAVRFQWSALANAYYLFKFGVPTRSIPNEREQSILYELLKFRLFHARSKRETNLLVSTVFRYAKNCLTLAIKRFAQVALVIVKVLRRFSTVLLLGKSCDHYLGYLTTEDAMFQVLFEY